MLQLEITQGLAKNWVLQAKNEDGSDAVSFLSTDTLTAQIWAGLNQASICSPTVAWFDGLASITLTAGGSGYSANPTVSFSGGGATSPAVAIVPEDGVTGGVITKLLLTDPGIGYTSNPTVLITDGTGTGATATATADIGWQYGHVALSITNAQSAQLTDANTRYRCNIVSTRGSVSGGVGDFMLAVTYAPGTATQIAVPYCTLRDMLTRAPWLTMIQDTESDQESFYDQRLEATNWINWLIVRAWRGTSAAYFGDAGRQAQFWSGSWVRRTLAASKWLIDQLSGGLVLAPITVTAPGSGYIYANVAFSGGGAPAAGTAQGSAVVSGGQVISIQLMSAGYGYTSAPTIAITGPAGSTGATATCIISQHALILRPQIVRICALKAASLVAMGQIGRNNQIASYGAMFRDMASSELTGATAEIDLNGNGQADLAIPLSVTNTMWT